MVVGVLSRNNTLIISNGGGVFNSFGFIGDTTSSSNNTVQVAGAGTVWSNLSQLTVGISGRENSLTIEDGGGVYATNMIVGLNASSTNNRVTITDVGSALIVTNSAGNGTYDIRRGTNVQNGGTVIANNLLVTNNAFFSETGSVYLLNGGTLITDGTIHSNGQNFLIGTNATFVARSGEHRFQGDIRVGDLGEGNTFIVTNSSQGRANSLFVGYDTTASNNLLLISGAGTTWTNNLGVVVGVYGMNNRLVVSNGAVLAGTSGTLGATAGSSSNSALIVGAGTIWTNTGRLLVGGVGGRSNLLEIIDGAYVASSNGVIGLHWSSISNVVVVSGVNAVWSNATSLVIGDEGGHNLLIVSNGGGVHSQTGTIGLNLPAETASNRVFVTGSGSFWSNTGTIIIGNSSWSNSLTINDGGLVMTDSMILGNNPSASRGNRLEIADTASQLIVTNGSGTGALNVRRGTVDQNGGTVIANNLLVTNPAVAGTGSVYNLNGGTLITDGTTHSNGQNFVLGTNATFVARSGDHRFENGLHIGESGEENDLIVSNAATVVSHTGRMGGDASSTGNTAFVTGDDSIWSNAGALTVGFQGGWNALTISNGGTVQSTNMLVGYSASSTNNSVRIWGADSEMLVTNAAGDSVLEVRRGFVEQNGGTVIVNQLLVTNSSPDFGSRGTYDLRSGTLISDGTLYSNGTTSFTIGSNATYVARSGDHIFERTLQIGSSHSGNQLIVSNGSFLVTSNSVMGDSSGSSNNLALITGPGTVWTNGRVMVVGNSGGNNQLTVNDGATVISSNTIAGDNASSSNNLILVEGNNSLFSNRFNLLIGEDGAGNTLVVSNGGTVLTSNLFVGRFTGSSNNTVLITDSGSVLSNRTLFVGDSGSGNRLLASNGATIYSSNTFLGYNSDSRGNTLEVSGAGTILTNRSNLYVGASGVSNQMTVSGGGTVHNFIGYIGDSSAATNNTVLVTGAGSVWSNRSAMYLGNGSAGNELIISNGGTVYANTSFVGAGSFPGSSNNSVVVTGADSLWSNRWGLDFGVYGEGNSLTISDGGGGSGHQYGDRTACIINQ
nr:hypothetical protein [Oscillatoria laete-virens]